MQTKSTEDILPGTGRGSKSGAFAVLYAPVDEDYGYVTVEAFLSGKPVVTCKDSGGTLDFVEDGVSSGYVADPEPQALAEAVDRRRKDPAFRARLRRIIEEDRELLERLAK